MILQNISPASALMQLSGQALQDFLAQNPEIHDLKFSTEDFTASDQFFIPDYAVEEVMPGSFDTLNTLSLILSKEMRFWDIETKGWRRFGHNLQHNTWTDLCVNVMQEQSAIRSDEYNSSLFLLNSEQFKSLRNPITKQRQLWWQDADTIIKAKSDSLWMDNGQAILMAIVTRNCWLLQEAYQINPEKTLQWQHGNLSLLNMAMKHNFGWLAAQCLEWGMDKNATNSDGGRPLSYVRSGDGLLYLHEQGAQIAFEAPAGLRVHENQIYYQSSPEALKIVESQKNQLKAIAGDIDVEQILKTPFKSFSAFQSYYSKYKPSQKSSEAFLDAFILDEGQYWTSETGARILQLVIQRMPNKDPWFMSKNQRPWPENLLATLLNSENKYGYSFYFSILPEQPALLAFTLSNKKQPLITDHLTLLSKIAEQNPEQWLKLFFEISQNPFLKNTADIINKKQNTNTDVLFTLQHEMHNLWIGITNNLCPKLGTDFIVKNDDLLWPVYLAGLEKTSSMRVFVSEFMHFQNASIQDGCKTDLSLSFFPGQDLTITDAYMEETTSKVLTTWMAAGASKHKHEAFAKIIDACHNSNMQNGFAETLKTYETEIPALVYASNDYQKQAEKLLNLAEYQILFQKNIDKIEPLFSLAEAFYNSKQGVKPKTILTLLQAEFAEINYTQLKNQKNLQTKSADNQTLLQKSKNTTRI